MGAVAAAVTFAVTGGNVAAAFAVYNLVDSVTTAAINGGDIGRALASAVASAALNFATAGVGSSANFLVNAGVNAARQAGISAVTAAITGGDPARAALGGLVSGAAGVIPYVGTIVGAGAAAEVQGGKFATGAIGAGVGIGTFAGTSFLLARLAQSGNLQQYTDVSRGDPIAQSAFAVPGPNMGPVAYEMVSRLGGKLNFYHYGYMRDAASISSIGIHAGGNPLAGAYGTPEFHTSASIVQHRFSLSTTELRDARYALSVDPARTPVIRLPPTEGGGMQVYFPKGVPREEVESVSPLEP